MELLPPKKIKIVEIEGKGMGVVATDKISKGEIIEYAPLIILREKDSQFIDSRDKSDTLYHYFLHQFDLKRNCIMLGYASIYNHSADPNAEIDYEPDPKLKYMVFRAIKDIEVNEEITWDYCFDNDLVEFLPDAQ
jgi:SET domain-containing protein